MPIGYEFQPGQERKLRGNLNRPGGGMLSPASQEAIKILSLRLPNVVGGRPPAPADLLRPQVGGRAEPNAVASSILQTSGADRPTAVSAPPPALNTPALSSPTAMPFSTSMPTAGATSMPTATAGRSEGAQLSSLVSNALAGGRDPGVSVGFEEDRKMPGETPRPRPQAPTPIPTPSPDSASPAPPQIAINDPIAQLLDVLFGSPARNGGIGRYLQ